MSPARACAGHGAGNIRQHRIDAFHRASRRSASPAKRQEDHPAARRLGRLELHREQLDHRAVGASWRRLRRAWTQEHPGELQRRTATRSRPPLTRPPPSAFSSQRKRLNSDRQPPSGLAHPSCTSPSLVDGVLQGGRDHGQVLGVFSQQAQRAVTSAAKPSVLRLGIAGVTAAQPADLSAPQAPSFSSSRSKPRSRW